MAITASYDSISQDLTVTGDGFGNPITIGRDLAGALLVNNGTIAVSGGPATVANTDLIAVSGGDGDDSITLDETNGVLPAGELVGGLGNDNLTGGSGLDLLLGEAGNDTLLGRGGADMLDGGADNDTLAGGDGDDQMFGGLGNDRLIWNAGDDNDLWEGGDGTDTGEINGGNGAETFTVTANGTRVRFDRIDPAPFTLDIGTTENLVLRAGGGDDSISTSGNLLALIALTLDGGAGNDTILGGNGADQLLGGDGNDFVDGNQGNDVAFLGLGDDVFQWDPGDGSDIVEGQAGTDRLQFNASGANETINLSANGARALLNRDVGAIAMDLDGVEAFTISAVGGADTIVVNDLSGTDVTEVVLNLAGTIGGVTGDAMIDTMTLHGSGVANTIRLSGLAGSVAVTGLPWSATLNQADVTDRLTIIAGNGNDTINATLLGAGFVGLTIDSGADADTILGSQGADILLAGDGNDFVAGDNGNDTAFLGAGDDRFGWNPGDGSDVVEGQAGIDLLLFDGSNANETVNVSANGGRILFLRDVASVTMDLDDVERIRFDAFGGADNITVGDLVGTDATLVDVHLEGAGGGGDGAADTVTANSTNGADTLTVSSSGGIVSATGLPWTVRLFGAEAANDVLTLDGLGGDDSIDASALAAGLVSLTVNGGLGADLFIGSAGADLFSGGDGNDTSLLGAGDDVAVWNPGDDNDVIEGQAGTDTLRFNGANVAESITVSPNGGRALFFRDVANVTMDLNDTEVIEFAALGGADTIVVNDLTGTDVTGIVLNLAGTLGGVTGDAMIDAMTLHGSGLANTISLSGSAGSVAVTGLPWSATISQAEATDQLVIMAGNGNDVISTAGLTNLTVALTLDGEAGNDRIQSTGDGTYRGGTGNDTILAGLTNSSEVLDGGDGIDTLDTRTWAGLYTINMVTGATNYSGESFLNFERLITGDGDDAIIGTTGANVIRTSGGVDNVSAGDGNDIVEGGANFDTLDGSIGIDTLEYRGSLGGVTVSLAAGTASGGDAEGDSFTGFENLVGSAFADVLTGAAGNNRLDGLAGNDSLDGGTGSDRLFGGLGDDSYFVDAAGDFVTELAGEGTDRIFASATYGLRAGVEVETLSTTDITGTAAINLTGNALANSIVGNAGNNSLAGGGGDDLLTGAAGADALNGGAGIDRASYAGSNAGVTVNLALQTASGGHAAGDTLLNIESLSGSGLADTLTGNAAANLLRGENGDDTLYSGGGNDIAQGGAGNDTINGGIGNDVISGQAGNDVLVGGDGLDSLVFEAGGGSDRIAAFEDNVDTLRLDDALWGGGLTVAQVLANFATQNGPDRVVLDFGGGNVLAVNAIGLTVQELANDILII